MLVPSCSPQLSVPTGNNSMANAISDDEAIELMYDFLNPDEEKARAAFNTVLEIRDKRFVSVFIELMRARQIGIIDMTQDLYSGYVGALATLSGEALSYHWDDWVEWYGKTDLKPPPGFTGWKGNLFSRIDVRFADFLHEDAISQIRVEEIMWGGVMVDGIPALDDPKMIQAEVADYLTPDEPVFGIAINGDARAFPLRIMDWHEMANDIIGGLPVSLSYCTLCGAAIAYDGRASNGEVYTFGSSGLLFRSNKLMYDRQTSTLWNQLTGEPVLGDLVGKDIEFSLLPVVLTSWKEWHDLHPETTVLDLQTGFLRPYDPGAAYGSYFASDDTMFPVWQRSELLDTKAQIYAININGLPKAYPVEILAEEQVINDNIGDTSIVLITNSDNVTVAGISRRDRRPVTYTAGNAVRAYERGKETFYRTIDAKTLLDADGRSWRLTEEALIGPDGEHLKRISGHLAYWFGWYAFFPNTLVYGE